MAGRIRKLLAAAFLFALAWFGARALYRALASPEKKIRWRMEEMIEGFNEKRVRPVTAGLAQGFVDQVGGFTRDDVRTTLAWMCFNEVDDKGEFLWSAAFHPEAMTIELAEDERSAMVGIDAQFFRRRGGARELVWDAHVAGTMATGDDGWQWTVVSAVNHEDRRR